MIDYKVYIKEEDPDQIFTFLQEIGQGSFGSVFKVSFHFQKKKKKITIRGKRKQFKLYFFFFFFPLNIIIRLKIKRQMKS